MPKQNRVTPSGKIISNSSRGLFMGNRGILHDNAGVIRSQWKTQAWITCLLEFKGRKRQILTPGSYTELFFLDEATAFSAGHRPCGECRYHDFQKFKMLWLAANPELLATKDQPGIKKIDQIIHRQRVTSKKEKVVFESKLIDLPNGVFIQQKEDPHYYLFLNNHLYRWSPAGYTFCKPANMHKTVFVLTPKSIVNTIAAGYTACIHPSVDSL